MEHPWLTKEEKRTEGKRQERGESLYRAKEAYTGLGRRAKKIPSGVKTFLAERRETEPRDVPKVIGKDVLRAGRATGEAAGKVALKGAVEGYERAPEVGRAVGEEAVSVFRGMFRLARRKSIGKVRKPVHPDKLIDKKSYPLYLSGGEAGRLIGGDVTPGSKEFYGLGNSKSALKDAEKVLQAINRGATDMDSISLETGLREMDVTAAVKRLKQEGYDISFLQGE